MTGQQMYDQLTEHLGGVQIDQDYALALFNIARGYIEMRRPWRVLTKKDTTQSAAPGNNWQTPLTLAPDFRRFLKDGKFFLFDGNNDVVPLTQVPFEDQLLFKEVSNSFYADIGAGQFYILGQIQKSYTVYQMYIFDPGDITLATAWLRFPSVYHPIIPFEAAAIYRLGTSYDDVNARNANDNARRSDMIFKAMSKWDTELALSAVNGLDYGPGGNEGYPFISGKIGPRSA